MRYMIARAYTTSQFDCLRLHSACLRSGVQIKATASWFAGNVVNFQRLAEVVALNFVTMVSPKKRHLRFVLDALGDHLQIQAFCHADDGGCDCRVVRLYSDISDKRAVDLEFANPKLSQGGEVGVASAKVVNRQRQPHGL